MIVNGEEVGQRGVRDCCTKLQTWYLIGKDLIHMFIEDLYGKFVLSVRISQILVEYTHSERDWVVTRKALNGRCFEKGLFETLKVWFYAWLLLQFIILKFCCMGDFKTVNGGKLKFYWMSVAGKHLPPCSQDMGRLVAFQMQLLHVHGRQVAPLACLFPWPDAVWI